jgi:hypothetical protein
MKRIVVRICAGLAAISRRHQLSRVVATAVAIVREPLMKAFSVASGSADIFVNEAERAVEAVFHGFGRRTKQTERYPFRICIKASNGATERQSLITTKTQPLRDHGSPQGQDRCTVDINGSTSAHWVQPDFKRLGAINPAMDLHTAPLWKYSLLFDQLNLAHRAEVQRSYVQNRIPEDTSHRARHHSRIVAYEVRRQNYF